MNIDSSCLQADKSLPPGKYDWHIRAAFCGVIMPFSSMILERLTSRRENASDECMGIGRPADECEDHLLQVVARCLLMTLDDDSGDLDELARGRLHQFALSNWKMSHHRN